MPELPAIKKNDEVYILRGKDRGKTGRVLIVIPKDQKVVVEGVQMIKRHTRPNPQRNIKGGSRRKRLSISRMSQLFARTARNTPASPIKFSPMAVVRGRARNVGARLNE